MTPKPLYTVSHLSTWDDLYQFYIERFSGRHKQWIFKGHADVDWHLRTTLERAFIHYFGESIDGKGEKREARMDQMYHKISKEGVGAEKRPFTDIEKGLLRDFKRKCHHHFQDVPPDSNTLEWLTVMQHHGAPTRLLDFTYSFFVALYFAVEDGERESAVWAIDSPSLSAMNADLFEDPKEKAAYSCLTKATTRIGQEQFFTRFFWELAMPRVDVLNAYRQNQRLIIQQGVFLCPGDISVPFGDNLHALLKGRAAHDNFIKLCLRMSPEERRTILRHLHRMNITRATLFPSLDGFAKSLTNLLIFPDILRPEIDKVCKGA